jgi:hypothetical protein
LSMSEVDVVSVRAPSLTKLEKELVRLLADCSADSVLGVSHTTATLGAKQSGGIWTGARHANKVEYSALVLLRAQ